VQILSQPPAGIVPRAFIPVSSYYGMPPVGITETRIRIGEVQRLQYTIRCGHSECWFVGHAAGEADAQKLLDQHAVKDCPTPPRRNELSSGFSIIEKMWDELDAALQAINEEKGWQVGDRVLDRVSLRQYALGLCFALSMMTHPHFRTVNDVLREGQRRYKMRTGAAPYQPTPTYRHNPLPQPTSPPVGERRAYHGETTAASARPATKRPARTGLTKAQTEAAAAVDLSTVDPEKRKKIITAVSMMGMTHEEVSAMFNVTPQTVKALVDGVAS
jgi:hypothetical protein